MMELKKNENSYEIVITEKMLETAWRCLPSPTDIDFEDDRAMKLMLSAVFKSMFDDKRYKLVKNNIVEVPEQEPSLPRIDTSPPTE